MPGGDAAATLRARAAGSGLLAVGAHGATPVEPLLRLGGGGEPPLLVARRSLDDADFPQSVLLASDGSPGSWQAARLALELAREKGAELRVAYVPDERPEGRPAPRAAMRDQLTMIAAARGARPPLHDRPGPVAERICNAAQGYQSSVIVIGRARSGGVSARVARRAGCSVLLVPG